MASQLAAYVAACGPDITLGKRTFTIEGIAEDGGNPNDIAVASFKAITARYTGVRCNLTKLTRHPGAEVWEIVSPRRTIACFALHEGRVIEL